MRLQLEALADGCWWNKLKLKPCKKQNQVWQKIKKFKIEIAGTLNSGSYPSVDLFNIVPLQKTHQLMEASRMQRKQGMHVLGRTSICLDSRFIIRAVRGHVQLVWSLLLFFLVWEPLQKLSYHRCELVNLLLHLLLLGPWGGITMARVQGHWVQVWLSVLVMSWSGLHANHTSRPSVIFFVFSAHGLF